jgi:hypothetical protein
VVLAEQLKVCEATISRDAKFAKAVDAIVAVHSIGDN